MALRVWLPLNKDLRNCGLSDLSFTNTSATLNAGGYYDFTGYTGKGILVGANLWETFSEVSNFYDNYISNHSFSLCCWVKTTVTDSQTPFILLGYGVGLRLAADGSAMITLTGSDGSGGTKYNATWTKKTTVNNGQWHHLVGTYDVSDNAIKIYLDGTLENTAYYPSGYQFVMNWENTICIGRNPNDSQQNAAYFFQGSLYDTRIYDHALSAKEVKELSKGLYLHYTFANPYVENTVNLVPNGMTLGWGDRWQIVSTYPEGIKPIGSVYKQIASNSYFGTASSFLGSYNTPTTYNNKYLTLSCWYYRNSSSSRTIDNNFGVYGNNGSSSYNGTTNFISKQNTDIVGKWAYGTVTIQFKSDLSGYSLLTYIKSPEGLNDDLYIANVQIEEKDHATPYTPSSRSAATILRDDSGFGNDGTIAGNLQVMPMSARYSECTKFSYNYIRTTDVLKNTTEFTITGWIYPTSTSYMALWNGRSTTGASIAIFYTDANKIRFDDSALNHSSITLPLNTWGHFACTYKSGGQKKIYINGIESISVTAGTNTHTNNYATIGLSSTADSTPSGNPIVGNISDFRIYKTALSASDILDLYQTGCAVDNALNLHCYEINEETNSDNKFMKNGVVKCTSCSEINNVFVEPDGSVWLKIFHHNNPTNALFSSTDSFTTQVYKDVDRWFNAAICNNVDKWELMGKYAATANDTVEIIRWIQNYNPMTATYEQTSLSNITRITNGYSTAWYSNFGGIYLHNSSTYLNQNDGSSSGDWWGAIGAWNTYQGGIPGLNHTTITTGYEDLYLRIDNVTFTGTPTLDIGTNVVRIGKNGNVTSNQLIEI